MKTTALKNIKNIGTLLLLLTVVLSVHAQTPSCTFSVENSGPCNIVVDIDYYDNTNTLCLSLTNQPISSYTSYPFMCGTCNLPLSNVVVTLVSVNSANPSGGTGFVDISNTMDNGGLSGPTCITPPQYNYTMNWFSTKTVIGY